MLMPALLAVLPQVKPGAKVAREAMSECGQGASFKPFLRPLRALTIAVLTAIACPTVVHRAIFAARLASRLICRKSNRANHRCEDRKQNFSVLFHTRFNVRTLLRLRERFGS